jgi:hypothetical protein
MINTETSPTIMVVRHSLRVRVNLRKPHTNILSLMRIRNGKPQRLSTDPLGTIFLSICKEKEWKCVKYRRAGSSADSSRGALQSEETESRKSVCDQMFTSKPSSTLMNQTVLQMGSEHLTESHPLKWNVFATHTEEVVIPQNTKKASLWGNYFYRFK